MKSYLYWVVFDFINWGQQSARGFLEIGTLERVCWSFEISLESEERTLGP